MIYITIIGSAIGAGILLGLMLRKKNAKNSNNSQVKVDLENKINSAHKELINVTSFALEYAKDEKGKLYTIELATSFQSAAELTRQSGEWKLGEVMASVKKLAEAANLAEKRNLQERALKLLNGHRVNHDTYSAIIDAIAKCPEGAKTMISSIEKSSKQKNSSSKKSSSVEEHATA